MIRIITTKVIYKLCVALALSFCYGASSGANYEVPKVLHFIWMGKQLPQKYVDNIRNLSAINPDYKIKIWTDRGAQTELAMASNEGARFSYEVIQIDPYLKEKLRLQKLANGVDSEYKNLKKLIHYFYREKEGLYSNYAAASDILRILILEDHGGIYLDTDLISGQKAKAKFKILPSFESPLFHRGNLLWTRRPSGTGHFEKQGMTKLFLAPDTLRLLQNEYNEANASESNYEVTVNIFNDGFIEVPFPQRLGQTVSDESEMKRIILEALRENLFEYFNIQGFGTISTPYEILLNFREESTSRTSTTRSINNNIIIASLSRSDSLKRIRAEVFKRYLETDPDILWVGKRLPNRKGPIGSTHPLRYSETIRISGPGPYMAIMQKELEKSTRAIGAIDSHIFESILDRCDGNWHKPAPEGQLIQLRAMDSPT